MNNKAYTLLEALLGIILLTILLSLCLNFLVILKQNNNDSANQEQLVVFLGQIQEDFLSSQTFVVNPELLSLTTYNEEEITYQKQQNRLVRQVNQAGYEIVLTDLKSIEFSAQNQVVKINLVFQNNDQYEGVLGAIK